MIVVYASDLVFDGAIAYCLLVRVTVDIVEVGEMGAKPVIEMCALLDLLVDIAMEHLAGLEVGIADAAIFVEEDYPRLRVIEHRPEAQRTLCIDFSQVARIRHVLLGADDDSGIALLVAAQHRERHHEIMNVMIATLHILSLQLKCQVVGLMAMGILLAIHKTIDGPLQRLEVALTVAARELLDGIGAGYLAVFIMPGKLMASHIIGPDAHVAGLDDQCQATIQSVVGSCQARVLQSDHHEIDEGKNQQQQRQGAQNPYPNRRLRLVLHRIEPLLVEFFQTSILGESDKSLVELIQQVLIFRQELILAVGHVHRCERDALQLIMVDEPFQTQGPPYDLSFLLLVDTEDSLSDIFCRNGIITPPIIDHQVMAEAGVTHDDLRASLAQITEFLDGNRLTLGGDDTLGELFDGLLSHQHRQLAES